MKHRVLVAMLLLSSLPLPGVATTPAPKPTQRLRQCIVTGRWCPALTACSVAPTGVPDGASLIRGLHVELAEDLAKVVVDRARADEEPSSDLGVRKAVGGESRDLGLLGCELAAGLDNAFAGRLAGHPQLAGCALGESLGAHRVEHLVRGAQLCACVQASPLAAQPLAGDARGRAPRAPGAAKPVDRLEVVGLCALAKVPSARQRAAIPNPQS